MNKCELHGNNRCDECNYILQLQKRINELVVECNKWKAQTIQEELGDELRAAQAHAEMLETEKDKWATYFEKVNEENITLQLRVKELEAERKHAKQFWDAFADNLKKRTEKSHSKLSEENAHLQKVVDAARDQDKKSPRLIAALLKIDSKNEDDTFEIIESCVCGHEKSHHIYEEGACRPGFLCKQQCERYMEKK